MRLRTYHICALLGATLGLTINFGSAALAQSSDSVAIDVFVMACVRTAPDHSTAREILRREGFAEDKHGAWTKGSLRVDPGKRAGGASPNPYCVGTSRMDPVVAGDLLASRLQSEGFEILSATRNGRKTSISTIKNGLATSFYVAPDIGGAMMSIFPTPN